MSKIPAPNYTQSPNILFDEVFKILKEGELRIILVLMRQTFGWHKAYDRISLSQLADKSGMERRSVSRSLDDLIEKGLVIKKKFGEIGKEKSYFSLVVEEPEPDKIFDDQDISEEEMDLLSNNSYQCPKDTTPVSQRHYPSVLKTPTKETIQKKVSKETLVSIASLLPSCPPIKEERREALKIEFIRGRFQDISKYQIESWQRAFPSLNIEASIAQFEVFLTLNPNSLHSSTSWAVRINSWILKQSQGDKKLKEEIRQSAIPLKEQEKPNQEIKDTQEKCFFYDVVAKKFVDEWSEKLGMRGILSFCSHVLSVKIPSLKISMAVPTTEKEFPRFIEFVTEKIKQELELTPIANI